MRANEIKIDRQKNTVTVPVSFLTAAGNIHSAEYQEYLKLKATYPNFTIVTKRNERAKNNGILGEMTYKSMSDFIKGFEPTQEAYKKALREMDDLRAFYKGQRGAYLKVKEWFLDKYKDEFERIKAEKEAEKRSKREADFLYHPSNI